MAYTTPRTWVAGEIVTAANLNTHLRDNIAWIATDSPSCRAYHSANQPLANNSSVAIAMNSERYDNAAMHSTATNTSRITIPSGADGKYLMGSCLEYAANATGVRFNSILVTGTTYAISQSGPGASGNVTVVACAAVYALAAADYIETWGKQDSGGPLNVQASANYSPEFWAFWFRN